MGSSTTVSRAVLEIGTDDRGLLSGLSNDKQAIRTLADQVRAWSGQVKADFKSAGESAKAFGTAFGDVFGDQAQRRAQQAAQNIAAVQGATKLTTEEVKQHLSAIDAWIGKAKKLGVEVSPSILSARDALVKVNDETQKTPSLLERIESKGVAVGAAIGSFFGGLALNALQTGVGALVGLGKAAIDDAGALVDLSSKTGLSTETLQRMQYVAKANGADMNDMADAAFKLGANIAGGQGSVRVAAERLGLEWSKLRAMNPDQQFEAVTDALAAMEDPQERNRIALDLFGKSVAKIIPTIVDGYSRMKNEATVASDAQVRALDQLGDEWDRFYDRQKARMRAYLGAFVQTMQTEARLTDEQRERLRQLQRESPEEAKAFLARMAKAVDVNLPLENKSGGKSTSSFAADLKAAESAYRNLTAAKKAEIAAAVALNKSDDDITNSLNLQNGVLAVAKKALEEKKSAESKAKQEAQKHAEALTEMTRAQEPLTLLERARIQWLERLGLDTGKIAEITGVSTAQISRYNEALKEEAKNIVAIGNGLGAVQHVQVRIGVLDGGKQVRNLSGVAPVVTGGKQLDPFGIDWEAIQKNNSMYLGRMADQARATYDYMRQHPSEFSRATIKHFKDIADAADREAGRTGTKWKDVFGSAEQFGKELGSTIMGAIQGGGNVFAAGAGFIGQKVGTKIAGSLSGSLLKDGAGLFSKALGGVIQSALPAVGALIGPLASALWGHFFGHAGRDAVKDFADKNGGFQALHDRLATLGAEGERLWVSFTQGVGRNNPEQAKRVIEEITAAFDRQSREIDTLNEKIGGVQKQIEALGGNGTPSLDAMQAAASRLGVSTDKLGSAFQSARSAADWQSVIDDVDLLVRGHADLDTVLDGAAEKFSKLAQDSLKFGTVIPENAKPWYEQLAKTGKLLDANGEKMTNIEGLHFGDSMQTTLEKLNKTLAELVETLNTKLTAAAKVAADGMNTEFGRVRVPNPGGGRSPSSGGYYRDPGEPPSEPPIPMAAGGFMRVTAPTLFLAGEAGAEDVAFSGGGSSFARAGGGGDMHVTLVMPDGDVLLKQTIKAGQRRGVFR